MSVAALCQQLVQTATVFPSQRDLLTPEQAAAMVAGHRNSFLQLIDRLARIDMNDSVELNNALARSGFEAQDRAPIAQAIAEKSLETVRVTD